MKSLFSAIRRSITHKKIDIFGQDDLLFSTVPYYLISVLLLLAVGLIWNHAWSLIFIGYVILPMLDEFFALDLRNPSEKERKELLNSDNYFKIPLLLTLAIDWFLFFKVLKYFSEFQFTFLGAFNLVAFWIIFSNINAVQFSIAHQLFHKQEIVYRVLGTFQMIKNFYMHFAYEHMYGHHRRVGTPQDPATAPQGMNVYQFFFKSYLGSYKSVYEMQQKLQKPIYLNYAVLSVVGSFLFTLLIYMTFGTQATVFFVLEAFLSVFYMQAINFIEHYGLSRDKLPNGEYQKVTIKHSWNTPHRFSNYVLFKSQRHSDHHQNSLKPYQTLITLDESPHFPHGYTLMIPISFFPQTWRQIMDPLLFQYKQKQLGRTTSIAMHKAQILTQSFIIKMCIGVAICWGTYLVCYFI